MWFLLLFTKGFFSVARNSRWCSKTTIMSSMSKSIEGCWGPTRNWWAKSLKSMASMKSSPRPMPGYCVTMNCRLCLQRNMQKTLVPKSLRYAKAHNENALNGNRIEGVHNLVHLIMQSHSCAHPWLTLYNLDRHEKLFRTVGKGTGVHSEKTSGSHQNTKHHRGGGQNFLNMTKGLKTEVVSWKLRQLRRGMKKNGSSVVLGQLKFKRI